MSEGNPMERDNNRLKKKLQRATMLINDGKISIVLNNEECEYLLNLIQKGTAEKLRYAGDDESDEVLCPACGTFLGTNEDMDMIENYCPTCGQKICK